MKQKFLIFVVFVVMAAILIGLNAATYTQKEKSPDSEIAPNRSSYNSGPTGTQAFFTLLSETGRNIVRWQEPADVLATKRSKVPATFVVIGKLRREFDEQEVTGLLRWVSTGGRLVIIDRDPPQALITTTGNWKMEIDPQNELNLLEADPSDNQNMTADTKAAKPGQPTLLTSGVNAIQASRFTAAIKFERFPLDHQPIRPLQTDAPPPPKAHTTLPYQVTQRDRTKPAIANKTPKNGQFYSIPTPTPVILEDIRANTESIDTPSLNAPVVHLISGGKNVLVDVPFGEGKIVFLSDPYIVSNGGIGLVDNARLAVNLVASGDGIIAFDEYHQGFGANNNRLVEFFAGTPVVAIFFQCVVLIGLVFFSQSRRFGRALPDAEPDRLSKLEYVSAMAELQQRTRAYDLAIENVYRDFRRRAARLLGVDNQLVSRADFANRISERSNVDRNDIDDLIYKCEEIVAGEPTSKHEVVGLVVKIRELEHRLGLRKEPRIQ